MWAWVASAAAQAGGIAGSPDGFEAAQKLGDNGLKEVPVFGATGEKAAQPQVVAFGFVNVDDGEVPLATGGDVKAGTKIFDF